MSAPRLTAQAWRALVCHVEQGPDDECECSDAACEELERNGLLIEGQGVTPAGLVAFGRLQHARRV